MKIKKLAILGLQLVLVIGLFLGVHFYAQAQIKPVEVLTWDQSVKANTKVQPDHLTWKTISENSLTSNMITDTQDVATKYTKADTFQGDYVSKNSLRTEQEMSLFEDKKPEELRKISINATITNTLGNDLKQGDKVDLIGVIPPKTIQDDVQKEIFVKGITVYNVTDDVGFDLTEGEKQSNQSSGRPAVITLIATPEQATEIAKWEELGEIKIVGRF